MFNRQRLIDIGVIVLIACAVVQTGFIARRELLPPQGQAAIRNIDDWQDYAHGSSLGAAPEAKVTLVEFADFQCPFCASFAETLRQLQAEFPGEVAVFYRHMPLDRIHPHATIAAIAAECAGVQGAFGSYHDALFQLQDSIGVRSWSDFAVSAGVSDIERFDACVAGKATQSIIDRDAAAVAELGLTGTPAVMINGELRTGAVSLETLKAAVQKKMD